MEEGYGFLEQAANALEQTSLLLERLGSTSSVDEETLPTIAETHLDQVKPHVWALRLSVIG